MNFRDSTKAQLNYLRRLIKLEEKQLKDMPSGRLVEKRAKGRTYYYVEKNGMLHSLLDQSEEKETYLLKKQLTQRVRNAKEDIPLLEKLLNRYIPVIGTEAQWNSAQSEEDYKEEEKTHCYKGVYYRSKSEIVVAAMLDSYEIPYKYEIKVKANGRGFLSDFFIKRPKDHKLFIWEHSGMVTDDRYRRRLFSKLENYHNDGIDLWNNLIMSFDQVDGRLDVDEVEKIIKLFLL